MSIRRFFGLRGSPYVLLVLTVAGIRAIRAPEPLGLDQGLFAYIGQRIPHGDLPYRDLWDSKPPGIFYTYALLFQLFGDTPRSIFLFETLYLTATLAVLILLARHLFNTRTDIAAAFAYLFFINSPLLGGFWATAQAETFQVLPILLSVYLILQAGRRAEGQRAFPNPSAPPQGSKGAGGQWSAPLLLCSPAPLQGGKGDGGKRGAREPLMCMASGIGLGIAVLFKLTALILLPCPLLYLIVSDRIRRHQVLLLCLGIALPIGLTALYFALNGAWEDLYEAVIVYNLAYAAVITQGQDLLRVSLSQIGRFVHTNALLSFLTTIGAVALLLRTTDDTDERPRMALISAIRGGSFLLLLWVLLSILGVWVQRQFAGYHFILLAPPIALLSARGAKAVIDMLSSGKKKIRQWMSHQATIKTPFPLAPLLLCSSAPLLLCLLFYMDLRAYHQFYRPDLEYARGKISRAHYERAFDRGSLSVTEHTAVARYIRDHTDPDDPILVWGLAPVIYYLSERRAATRYPFHHVLLTKAPLSLRFPGLETRRNAFLNRLHREPPAYILIGLNDPNGFEPTDSYTQLRAFPPFNTYVARHYTLERRTPHFLIARRKDRRP